MVQKIISTISERYQTAQIHARRVMKKALKWLLSIPMVRVSLNTFGIAGKAPLNQRRQQFIMAFLGIAFLYAFYALVFGRHISPPDARVPISVALVNSEDRDKIVKLTGSVVSFSSVAIKARLDSQIVKINVNDGDTVKEGDLLFELDDTLIKAQIAQAEAIIRRDKSELERSERQFKRDSELVKRGNTTKEQYDKSKQASEAAKAALDYSEASLRQAQHYSHK